jgi:hypothetical protein
MVPCSLLPLVLLGMVSYISPFPPDTISKPPLAVMGTTRAAATDFTSIL